MVTGRWRLTLCRLFMCSVSAVSCVFVAKDTTSSPSPTAASSCRWTWVHTYTRIHMPLVWLVVSPPGQRIF